MKPNYKLSKEHLAPEHRDTISFECIICYELLDLNTACECLECEVAICRHDCQILEQNNQTCPYCRSSEGFKKKLSRSHKQKIESLRFNCPNTSCKLSLKYTDAINHIPNCQSEASEVESLKKLLAEKDRKIQRMKQEKIQNH